MELQAKVRALLQDFIDRGIEQGLQVAAYFDGRLIVDTWAGLADPASGRAVDGDTLFFAYSAGKGVAATAIHLLVQQGELAYDRPIAYYWPEFRAGGKDRITLRHVLTHTAALPHMHEDTTTSMICDWEAMCRMLAAQSPLWTPGTTIAYHALTYGWLVGEVARRVTGMPFNQFVQEAICRPLHIDSLFFGISDAVEPRVAVEEGAPEHDYALPDPIGSRAVPTGLPLVQMANLPDVRRATIPGAAGIMNARALARHYAALVGRVNGEMDGKTGGETSGVRLLSPEMTAYAGRPHQEGIDANGGNFTCFALGYHTGRPGGTMGERAAVFGHGGYGGTLGFADPEYGMAFALHKNRVVMSPQREETVAYQVANLIRAAVGIPVD